LGILLYEITHGNAPFNGKDYNQVFEKIKKGDVQFDKSLSNELKGLICVLLQSNPSRRVGIDKIFQHT